MGSYSTPVAESVPFEPNRTNSPWFPSGPTGITSIEAQSAIEEVKAEALSAVGARIHTIYEEFLFATLDTLDVFHFLNSEINGGTAQIEAGVPIDNSYAGAVVCGTGTSSNSTGVGSFGSSIGNNKIKAGGGDLSLEFRIRIPVLSGTPAFAVKIGLQDNLALGNPANGLYFSYTHSANSGRWQWVARNASVSTTGNSSVPVVANQWIKLQMQVNRAGTLVTFLINDVVVGTSSTNIPTTNAMRISFKIEKTSSSTTSRTLVVDSVYYRMER